MTSQHFVRIVLPIAWLVASVHPARAIPRGSETPKVVISPAELVYVEVQKVEKTHIVNPLDGSTVTGGHVGVALDCTPCPQAYAKRVEAGGAVAWHYTAHADKDCDGDGEADGEGDPLFEDWTAFDPAFIFGSTMSAATLHPGGDVFYYGQVLVAFTVEGILQGAWGAFVMRFTPGGALVGQAYFGAVPQGEPPAVASCEALCSALNDSTLEQNGSGAIALRQGSVAIGGWKRSPVPGGVGDKDVFVALLDEGLAAASWIYERGFLGSDDEVRAVDFDSAGHVFVAGYFETERDGFALRFDAQTGDPTQYLAFGGPLDDEGTGIEVEGPALAEVVRVDGFFTDEMWIGGQHVTGSGVATFSACLTKQMAFVSVETPAGGSGSCAAGPSQPSSQPKAQAAGNPQQGVGPESEVESAPVDVDVLVGQSGNCRPESSLEEVNCVARVERSDDKYLHVYGEFGEDPEDGELLEIEFTIDVPEAKPRLTRVSFELVSDYCSTISISLGGGNLQVDTFIPLGEIEVCPLDEPVITIEVPEETAQELGFWNGLPQHPLISRLRQRLFGIACSTCDSLAKDSELDHFTAGSGDPEL